MYRRVPWYPIRGCWERGERCAVAPATWDVLIVLACFIYKRDSSGDKEVTMTKVFGIVRFLGDIVFRVKRSHVSVIQKY